MPSHHGDTISSFDDLGAMLGLDLSGLSASHPSTGPRGASIMAIGDSITANGWSSGSPGVASSAQAWLMWAVLYSQGGLTLTAPYNASPAQATSGFTTAQMLATHLPVVTAHKPALCAVLGGANDIVGAVPLQTTFYNLTAIYQGLLSAGVLPVLCTMTPRTGPPASVTSINTWIKRYARANGLPLVDTFQSVVDTTTSGTFQAGLTIDGGGHPNSAGAKLMGQTFWNAIKNYMGQEGIAPLAGFNLKVASDTVDILGALTQNSLFLLDTNADGVPNGWILGGGGGGTGSIASAATSGVGNYWKITRGTTDSLGKVSGNMTAAADSDRIQVVTECISTVEATSGAADVLVTNADGTKSFAGLTGWATDIPAGSVLSQEFFWRTGSSMVPYIQANAKTTASTLVGIARSAIYNLTAAGIA